MWSARFLLRLQKKSFKLGYRTFVSESYSCKEAWNKRFENSVLGAIKPRDFFIEIDAKMLSEGKISAVDIDIFANTVKDADSTDELVNILHRFRLTAETSNTLDSTHHAFIRFLLDHNDIEALFHVLNDRLNYGIFPDYLCYNIMMDKFIKSQDFSSAAKVATLLMLQEDYDHPVCNALAVYSCHKHLEHPELWQPPEPEPVSDEEPIKIRVEYLRNPFFDDHFDITDPKLLVGKSLVFFGRVMKDNPLGRTCMLRGFILWEKYDRANALITDWMEDTQARDIVYEDTLPLIEKEVNAIPEEKCNDEVKVLKENLEKLKKCSLKDGDIIEEMKARIKSAVQECEAKDIANQLNLYKKWDEQRTSILNKQLAEINKQKRIKELEELKANLTKRERLLTFFEKEEKLELDIEKKLAREEKKYGPPPTAADELEQNYVPPEITSKSRPAR